MMKIQKIEFLNSFKYINLKDIVLDIVYDGFNLRFYLIPIPFLPLDFILSSYTKLLNNI